MTASGKPLGKDPRSGLEAWKKLPASEREPDAVKVAEDKDTYHPPAPPENGLILKVYYRTLARNDKGELRQITTKDFTSGRAEARREEFTQAQPDFMWITEPEWKALVPASPKKGDRVAVPASLSLRLFRFHLDPRNFYGVSAGNTPKDLRETELTLTVEGADEAVIRLRLGGSAKIGTDFETALALGAKKEKGSAFEPRLLGYLEYDRKKKAFTRFDALALGDLAGILTTEDYYPWYRPGRQPLGASFELVDGKVAANRTPPGSTAGGLANYLKPAGR